MSCVFMGKKQGTAYLHVIILMKIFAPKRKIIVKILHEVELTRKEKTT